MLSPEQSSDFGEYGDDLPAEGMRQRGRKKAAAAMTRSRKRSTRKRGGGSGGGATQIVGMSHRRHRRWSW